MSETPHIDPEQLAALLEGRLSDAEAARVRASLAASDDDTLSAFADAVAIAPLVGPAAMAGNGGADVVRLGATRSRRWVWPSLAAAAAVMLAVVLARSTGPGDARSASAADFAAALSPSISAPTSPVWSATRGSAIAVSDRVRAVRIGALAMDLELSLLRGDNNSVVFAEALATELDGVTGGGIAAANLRSASTSEPNSRTEALRRSERSALALVDRELATAGSWLEAARASLAANDSAFVTRFDAMSVLQPLTGHRGLTEPQRAAVRRVITASAPGKGAHLLAAINDLLLDLAQ